MTETIRIATRKSPLAMWQAEHVADTLRRTHPGLVVEILGMSTRGDKILDAPLAKIGGKGLFVKELEQGMLEGRADIAVHSMKDVPVDFPGGLHLPVIMEREDPRDAFVSSQYAGIDDLPYGVHTRYMHGDRPVELYRTFEGVRARSLLCTHQGCDVKWVEGDNIYLCPCHDGKFDADGEPIFPVRPEGTTVAVRPRSLRVVTPNR